MRADFFMVDRSILILYFIGVILFGAYFRKKSNTSTGFMIADGRLPGWAVGLSILGTFVSSITFLAYPGQAYNFNWDVFVFSLTLPIAAVVAILYFIPLYRTRVKVSAYEYLEQRFGQWARIYGSVSFMLGSLARIGMILFLVSLVLHNLTGWSYATIIIITGAGVTLYTVLGGIEAVIWTDVIQVIILFAGAVITVIILLTGMPEGPGQILSIAREHGKFSLGNWKFDLVRPTAWVVVIYGIIENFRNFGVDQNYVQRYQTTRTLKEASRSVWTAALLYIPVSALFLFIGTGLFAYYSVHPELLPSSLNGPLAGDRIYPYFIVTEFPAGLRGLIIAAILAAAMSSIDSSLNCVSTLSLLDFYKRYLNRDADDRLCIRMLRVFTVSWGILGTATGLAMIQVQTALETGWQLAGIAGGGLVGLFLLGILSARIRRWQAVIAVTASIGSITWATFVRDLPGQWAWLECAWHSRLIGVIGTITLLIVGFGLSLLPLSERTPADQTGTYLPLNPGGTLQDLEKDTLE
ncbi:MAG: sodium:solute symporter [Deltaproteobacteria bacterium]|nr:sodium:solute symporter [Deltaproteobacteria bacterium]MBW2049745.1 sodium:solute symporter [Deltaproteobacteria bacterium]MBW2113079.1 sodium:solute symporter [Deltaproteobacteria bacterium]MBW2354420.1 sodium:solute symporter [Deltaproteobacteria bacterium]HDZ91163.1 sodium:solute symporter [Deltaproteobacteria bacterium]